MKCRVVVCVGIAVAHSSKGVGDRACEMSIWRRRRGRGSRGGCGGGRALDERRSTARWLIVGVAHPSPCAALRAEQSRSSSWMKKSEAVQVGELDTGPFTTQQAKMLIQQSRITVETTTGPLGIEIIQPSPFLSSLSSSSCSTPAPLVHSPRTSTPAEIVGYPNARFPGVVVWSEIYNVRARPVDSEYIRSRFIHHRGRIQPCRSPAPSSASRTRSQPRATLWRPPMSFTNLPGTSPSPMTRRAPTLATLSRSAPVFFS